MGSVETNFLMNRDSVMTVWKLSYSYEGMQYDFVAVIPGQRCD